MDEGNDKAERDRALVYDVLAQREGAFTTLVEQHQRLVWHLVSRMVQHPEDCRDLCQEVFLRVHRNLRQFRAESTLATWIGRIAYNICARHLQRKQLPMVDPDESGTSPADSIADDFDLAAACANEDLMTRMHATLEALPPISRTVLTLYYLEEMSVGDVAAILEKPEGTVKNLLFRARNLLRARLEARLEISDDKR